MATVNEGLLPDKLLAAGDPISCRQVFWDALAIADEGLAVQAAMLVRPPPVTAFDFDESDNLLGEEERYGKCLPVEPDTPTVVLNVWNSSKKTGLVALEYARMCLCKSDIKGGGKKDVCACVTPDCQSLSHQYVGGGDASPKYKLRPSARDNGGTFAIKVPPSTTSQTLSNIFSWPLFYFGDLPH